MVWCAGCGRCYCFLLCLVLCAQDVPKHDPTHLWFLGTGRDVAAEGIEALAPEVSTKGTRDGRLDDCFALFIQFCRKKNMYPSISRFSVHLSEHVGAAFNA